MSASEGSREKLAGLTLDAVLANQKRAGAPPPNQPPYKNRTLLDIIREDESTKKDRRSWKAFKDKIRLKRAGSAWTSSIHIPTSDVPMSNPNSRNFTNLSRRNSVRFQTHPDSDMSNHYNAHQVEDLDTPEDSDSPANSLKIKPTFSRKGSTRFAIDSSSDNNNLGNLRPQLSRRNSTNVQTEPYRRGRVVTFRDNMEEEDEDGYERHPETGRALSAREAVAAQEAAEAAAAAEEEEEDAGRGQVTMSLMDLLEETDREMGLEGSRYILSDDDDDDDDDEQDGVDNNDDAGGAGAMEHSCCICMVRHKGAALIPCGHTFCRMCSRELMVSKGNCPICNNFILEILDIF